MRYQLRYLWGGLASALSFAILISSCGKSSSSDLTAAAPAYYVTSGVSSASSREILQAAAPELYSDDNTGTPAEDKPPAEAKSAALQEFKKSPTEMAQDASGVADKKAYRSPCFGPPWTDNAASNGGVATQDRPPGDTGIIYKTRDASSQMACAAAQLGSLIAGRAHMMNKIRALAATLIAKGGADGVGLPTTVGSSVSVTMPSITGMTFSKSELELAKTGDDGRPVYKITIEATKDSKPLKVTVYHSPKNDDNTQFEGAVEAIVPHTASQNQPGNARGLAMVYKQTATDFNYVLEGAANRQVASQNFFKTGHRIDFSSTAAGEDMFKMIMTVNLSTYAATVHYAWQAGNGDQATRNFHLTVTGRSNGATGKAYFGFGATIGSLSDNPGGTAIWATKMHCNWKGDPIGTSSHKIDKIQKQVMSFADGVFKSTSENIDFAPTNTCDIGVNWTISNGPPFKNGTQGAITNNLVTYTSGDIPQVTPPTVTLP